MSDILLRRGDSFDINLQDADGVTLLHLAALRSEALVFLMIEEGADPEIVTNDKRNALHLACRARQSNVVGFLSKVSSST